MSGQKRTATAQNTQEEPITFIPLKKPRVSSPAEEQPLNLLNPHYTLPTFTKPLHTAFRKHQDYTCLSTKARVHSNPFPTVILPNLFDPTFLKSSDSLEVTDKFNLGKLRDLIYSEQFTRIVEQVTGFELENGKIDLSAHIYKKGQYLLCHDDDIKDEPEYGEGDDEMPSSVIHRERRVAFIVYLVEEGWEKGDGGTLDLFDIDSQGNPRAIDRSIIPQWNTMAFFEVSPTSYHQVSEVLTDTKRRLSISGWFHGSLKSCLSLAEYSELQQHSKFDISEFVNPEYLTDATANTLLKIIDKKGSVELRGFLKEDVYKQVLQSLDQAEWEERAVGPPNVRKYHLLKQQDNEKAAHHKIHALFCSTAFGEYLERITHLPFAYVSSQIRQFRSGDYTVAHDKAGERAGVDVVLYCIEKKWTKEWGGDTVYYDENQEKPIHTLWPAGNTLTITERIDGIHHFVKYVNCFAEIPRRDMAFIYVQDNEDGIEEEGDGDFDEQESDNEENKEASSE